MKMKRTLSLLLVLAALLTMVPVAVSADDTAALESTITMGESNKTTPVDDGVSVMAWVRLNKSSLTLVKGASYRLKLNVSRSCRWSTSNRRVATVSSKGTVKAVGYGSCTIYCRLSNGTRLSCRVSVRPRLDVQGVSLSDGRFYFRLTNRYSTKTLKKAVIKVTEYNSYGYKLTSYLVSCSGRLGPKQTSGIWYVNLKYPYSCDTVVYSPYRAYYTNGTVWKP